MLVRRALHGPAGHSGTADGLAAVYQLSTAV